MAGLVRRIRETLAAGGPQLAISRAANYARLFAGVAGARRDLRRRGAAAASIPEALDFVEGWRSHMYGIEPFQVRSEIELLLETLRRRPPRTVLEIGTAWGGTLFLLTRAADDHALLVTLDRGGGVFGRLSPQAILCRSFARGGQRIVPLVSVDSHDPRTLGRVRRALRGREVDFLFIDGDHSYEGVALDFEMYGPLVRSGGLVAFHDIVPGLPQHVGGVPEFWRSLRDGRQTEEIVESWEQGGYGIGLLHVP